MRISLLGALQLEAADGSALALGGAKPRTLIALLALRHGEIVTVDEIIEILWAGEPSPSATNALHVQVSKLRRILGSQGEALPLRTVHQGYILDADPDDIDIARFERLARAGADDLAFGHLEDAARTFEEALALWRGPALAEFTFEDFAVAARLRLDELRATVCEHRFDALLGLGRHEQLVPELEPLLATSPMRERLWGQLMIALYRSGRQADALRAFTRARTVLVEEMGIEPGEELRTLERRILQQDPGLAVGTVNPRVEPVAPVARSFATNLRPELSSFVGRTDEVRAIGELVAQRRLVTLVGPGGVGKTRLATEVALRSRDAAPDGAWMIELYATSGPSGVARALLAAFGGRLGTPTSSSTDVQTAVELVAPLVGTAELLIVLDNCEHVVADAAIAASELLGACPNVRILATSRVVLDIPGEAVRQLQPLDIDDAVALFETRGIDARDGFVIEGANRDAVHSICERVDRLPLGIELAAARLRAFTPTQLDGRLAERLGSIGGPNRAPRQRTMPATVEWSYDLLFDDERTVLRRLSVFRGTFALDAVEVVAAGDDLDATDVAETLARLVDKSLVVTEASDDEPRYRLLRTVEDFAASVAGDRAETADLRDRHAAWVADLARRGGIGIRGPDQDAWVRRLQDEAANVDAALSWAHQGGDGVVGLRTAADLTWFAMTSTALPTIVDDLLAMLDTVPSAPRDVRARALGWAALIGAGLPAAASMADEAIDLARAEGDPQLLAETLLLAAMPMSRHVTTAGGAIELCQEGRRAAEIAGDEWLLAVAASVEGNAWALTPDDLDKARARLEEADRRYLAIGDRSSAEINASYLSHVLEDCGDLDRAEAVLLPFAEGRTAPVSVAAILATARLAWIANRRGDRRRAVSYAEQLVAATSVRQRRLFWAVSRQAFGHALLAIGRPDEARLHLEAALEMHTQFGFDRHVITEHALLGHIAQRQGRVADSLAHHRESVERAQRFTVPLPLVFALDMSAASALHRGDPLLAAEEHAWGLALRNRHHLPPTEYEARESARFLRRTAELAGEDAVAAAMARGEARVDEPTTTLDQRLVRAESGHGSTVGGDP